MKTYRILSFILLWFFVQAGIAQAPEKRFVGNCQFTGFSLVADSTYQGNITSFSDRFGDGYNASMIAAGYEILDGRGLVFAVDSVISSTYVSAVVRVTAKVNRGLAPFGSGQVYQPTSLGLIPASSVEQAGLSPVSKARIDRHNVVQLDSFVRAGIDTIYSITYVPDTSGISPNIGDAFVNAGKDTMGLYDGGQWVLFFGGSGSGLTDGDKGDIDVTSSGAVWTIDTNAVTVSKIFDDVLSSVNFVVNDGGNIDLASEGDITVTPVQDSLKIFLDLADGAVDWDELSGPVQDSIQAAQDSIAMINSQLDTLPSASGTANRIARFSATRRLVDSYMQQTASSLAIDANIGLDLGIWTTASRPAGLSGRIGYNETNGRPEAYITSAWHPFVMGASTLTNGRFSANRIPVTDANGFLTESDKLLWVQDSIVRLDRTNTAGTSPGIILKRNGYSTLFGLYYIGGGEHGLLTTGSTIRIGGTSVSSSDILLHGSLRLVNSSTYPGIETANSRPALWVTEANTAGTRIPVLHFSQSAYSSTLTSPFVVEHNMRYIQTSPYNNNNANLQGVRLKQVLTADSTLLDSNTLVGMLIQPSYAIGNGSVSKLYARGIQYKPASIDAGVDYHYGLTIASGLSGFGTENPVRTVHIEGEARITDLTTDTPTRLVGADADGDLGEYAIAWGHLKKTSATSLTLGITDLRITGMTAGPAMNTTLTDSTITVGVAGTYEIKYSGSASLDPTTGGTYLVSFSMYNNSTELVETTSDYEVVVSASNNWFGSVGGHTIIDLADGDVISVRYNGTTGTPAELRNISISVRKL